jgi:hypothetical protein
VLNTEKELETLESRALTARPSVLKQISMFFFSKSAYFTLLSQ